ncbi:MAG TPA: M23 family metallopeptidase [Myxococcaceae bacterium]|nr:M23 family metallopeptidase [Myxococcaceae bacterium]
MPRRLPMPTLGLSPKKKSPIPKVIAFATVAGLVAGGIYWIKEDPKARYVIRWRDADAGQVQAPSVQVAVAPEPEAPVDPLEQSGLRLARAVVNGPLEKAIVDAAGASSGRALTQVVTRLLVWWIDVPGDLLKGDKIDVLFEERAGEEPLVHAVRLESMKSGRSFQAFRFRAPQEAYARYYQPSGEELELRLEDAPLEDYEQVTSLLRDGRRHKGVDFKVREGTPVRATFDGTVTRRNWSFRGNGNSIELTDEAGRRKALFLHLSELPKNVRVGSRFRKGEVLAQSGNSGRSFAPHLHYQLMAGETKVLDPFDVHRTYRRRLAENDRAGFEAEVRRLETLLSSQHAGR